MVRGKFCGLLTRAEIGVLSVQYDRLGPRAGHRGGRLGVSGSAWITPSKMHLLGGVHLGGQKSTRLIYRLHIHGQGKIPIKTKRR